MANSIIGDSFDKYVKEQILVRQSVLGLGLNQQDVINYKHNNSAFIRLTSGVNVDENIVRNLELNGDQYKGSGLAKQFKLFSARTQANNQETFTKGIGYNDFSSYGFMSGPEYGYVPPPGITSVEVKALNRGSLREANIEIQCHNLQQFQIIEILYMRLKYSILLEWGHNMYYTNPTRDENLDITQQPQLQQSRFDLSDNMLSGIYSQDGMLKLIADTRKNSYGNYDAFFGLVTNFSWTLRPDGGYNITVTARSMGDVIESLKINTAYPIQSNPTAPGLSNNSSTPNSALQTDFYKSSLNRVLSAIAYQMYNINYAHGIDQGNGSYNPVHNYKLEEYTGLKAAFNRTTEAETKTNESQDYLTYNEALNIFFPNLSGGSSATGVAKEHYYIKLGTLLRIVESFLVYYDTSKGNINKRPPIFKIDYNYNTNYCLTFPRHASLNPKVCLIPIEKTGSSDENVGLVANLTQYTYLSKAVPYTSVFGATIPREIDFSNEAGIEFYNNQFGWREETRSSQYKIEAIPGPIEVFAFNDSYISQLESIWSTPQINDEARNTGYDLIKRLRNQFLSPKGYITPVLNQKYITNIDVEVFATEKTIVKEVFRDAREAAIGVGALKEEKIYKATITVYEYRNLGSNYGGGNQSSNEGEPVYEKILKDNPFRAGGFKGRMMHMLVHMGYITDTLTKYLNVETGELSLYDFLDNLMKGIQHALGNVNNFEIIYDEENNIHRIIDNTSIPGIVDISKGIVEFNANILQSPNNNVNNKIGGSFIKNVNFKTKLSNNFATMTTIGAQKNGNAVGANATMLSRWNDGLTDRIITNRENPNYNEATSEETIENTFIKNITALQDLNNAINLHTVGDYEVDSFQGAINDLFQAELGKYTKLPEDNEESIPGIGFIPFDLELTMLGLSGPRIYEAYTIDTTLLPNSYKNKIQFICTGVSHKIADGEWTTTLNSIAGPKPYGRKTYNPKSVKVLPDRAEEANRNNNNNENIPTGTFLGNAKYNPIKSVVFKDESSSYDSLFPSTTYTAVYGVAATTKTIQQIIDEGRVRVTSGYNGVTYSSSAVGRYQQITRFINDRAIAVGLNPTTDLYDELNQEKMGEGLIDKSCGDYIKGVNEGSQSQLEAAVQALAQQFASKPVINKTANTTGNFGDVTTGVGNTGYYGGDDAGNPKTVRVNVGQVVKGLIDTRKNFVDINKTGIGGLPTFIPSYY